MISEKKKSLPLPERRIPIDRTIFYIHGLIHGTVGVKINSLIKKEVNQQLKDFCVVCEDGFSSWIPNAISMNEAEYFNLNKLSFIEILRFWKSFAYFYLSSLNKQEPEILSRVRKMNSIEDLIEMREEMFKKYLPEPEGMNLLMGEKKCGRIDSPKGDIPLCVRRYLYESKFALDYASKNNVNELHIVVGCAHELPLEYLLNNKEILDKYLL